MTDTPMSREQVIARFGEADAAYQAQEWQRAADLYADLFIEPEALQAGNEVHWNYAMCLAHLDQMDLALQHVRAGGYDEDDFRAAMGRSNVRDAQHDFAHATQLYQNQQWSEACDAFAELLLHPGYPASEVRTMHWNMAMCFAHLGDMPLALQHVQAGGYDEAEFRTAMSQSNLRDAQHDFAHATQLFQNQQWSEACDAFAELLLHPGYPASEVRTMHWNMALCFAHLGDWDTAFSHVRAGGDSEEELRAAAERQGLHPPAVE